MYYYRPEFAFLPVKEVDAIQNERSNFDDGGQYVVRSVEDEESSGKTIHH